MNMRSSFLILLINDASDINKLECVSKYGKDHQLPLSDMDQFSKPYRKRKILYYGSIQLAVRSEYCQLFLIQHIRLQTIPF